MASRRPLDIGTKERAGGTSASPTGGDQPPACCVAGRHWSSLYRALI